jgi:hypothetical protein
MTKTFRFVLLLIGVLLFAIGLLLGQQAKRSKYERYLRETATQMDIAVLRANIQVLRVFMPPETPTIYYEPSCPCVMARSTMPSEWAKEPLDKVRAKLMGLAITALWALPREFPELSHGGTVSDRDFKMTFSEINLQNPETLRVFAEYTDGKIVFK